MVDFATLIGNFLSDLLVLKTFFALIVFFLASDVAPAQHKTELQFINRVSTGRLQQTVRDLVNFGNRQGGTRSGDKAVKYLTKQFKTLGLKVEVLEDPERLTFTSDQWNVEVLQPAKFKGLLSHSWLAGFSPSAHRKSVRLISVPANGDISKIDVDSAAVLLDLNNANRLYKQLAEKGAVCLLTWAEAHSDAYANSAFIENLSPSLDNPIPVFDISRNSAISLTKTLDSKRTVLITFSSKTRILKGKSKTVVATLPGRSKNYYIVCAHGDSDSGGPGADDNASGDSGVLEIARILSGMNRNGMLPKPDSSIKFIIWGSEYSSTEQYVKQHSTLLSNIVGVLNFDEIGTGATRDCIYFEGNDQRINYTMLKILEKVGEDYAGKKSFWHEATTNPSQGGTDSYVFLPNYLSRLGVPVVEIPSITVYTAAWQEPKSIFQPKEWRTKAWKGPEDSVIIDYSLYYHSSMDLPSTTTDKEPKNMVWGVRAVGIALLRLLWQ